MAEQYPNSPPASNCMWLTIPPVPSLNNVYRNVRINLRIMTSVGKAWQQETRLLAKLAASRYKWEFSKKEKLVMNLWIYWPDARRRDSDNVLKLLSDTLQGILFEDDCWVMPRVMDFNIDRANPRVVLSLEKASLTQELKPAA